MLRRFSIATNPKVPLRKDDFFESGCVEMPNIEEYKNVCANLIAEGQKLLGCADKPDWLKTRISRDISEIKGTLEVINEHYCES